MSALFDPGLQPERTALSWRRTGLALFSGSAVATRILPETLGPWAAGLGLAGMVAASLLIYGVKARYQRLRKELAAGGDRPSISDGRLPALLCIIIFGAGLVSIASVLAGARQ